jgi:S-adenosylmethionine:diacylglycerol 3-amino-3-carboxypropyl transferase
MAKLLNFWTEDEATDLFYYIGVEETYENFCKYLIEFAPHLCKKSQSLWNEMNR